MRGVAVSVDPTLRLEDLTHEIPAFDIWEGAYRLNTTAPYWPPGTVFVSVIDPGVGTERRSVVLKTALGPLLRQPGQRHADPGRGGPRASRRCARSTRAATAGRARSSRTPSTAATCTPTPPLTSPRAGPRSRRSAPSCRPRWWRSRTRSPRSRAGWCAATSRSSTSSSATSGPTSTAPRSSGWAWPKANGSRCASSTRTSRCSPAPCPTSRPSATCRKARRCSI